MNILLVTLSYPPLNNAQSIRWGYLTHYFRKLGCSVSIVAPDICSHEEGVIPCSSGITISKLLSHSSREKRNNFLLKGLLYLYETVSLGDAYIEWAFRLKRCLNKLDLRRFDVIVFSVELSISTILPILSLRHPVIVLDIADPPIPGRFSGFSFYKPIYDRVFVRILSRVAGVVYTGYSPKYCLEEKFQVLKEKRNLVLYQGFPTLYMHNSAKEKLDNDKLKIFYAGNFIKDIRDPVLFANVLSNFRKEILFVHAGNDIWKSLFEDKLQESFIYLGKLSHEETIKWYRSMDILLYLGNTTSCQQSGKYFEYLGFKKPVLHIYQNFRDDTVSLFSAMPAGISVFYDKLSLDLAMKRLLSTFKANVLNLHVSKYPEDLLMNFSWEYLSRKYISFLEDLC